MAARRSGSISHTTQFAQKQNDKERYE
jgi:hypothetical protein